MRSHLNGGAFSATAPRHPGSPAAALDLVVRAARRCAQLVEEFAPVIYLLLFAIVLAQCTVAIATFTVEPDEGWILLSTYKALGLGGAATREVVFPTVTTGGLHFLLHGALATFTRSIVVHRVLSVVALAGVVLLVFAVARRRGASRGDAALTAALVLATPGLVLQAGLATGEAMATLLLLASALHWERSGRLTSRGALVTGLLLGLACATRTNCLVALPVFCAFSLLDAPTWSQAARRTALTALAAVAVYALCVGGYVALFAASGMHGLGEAYLNGTGFSTGQRMAVQNLLSFSLAGDFFPPALVAALLAGLAVARARGAGGALRLPLLLALVGLAGALAWVAKAPIPHVRYAWPFAPLLFVAAGLVAPLTGLLARAGPRLALHSFAIGAIVQQAAIGTIYVKTGDSLVTVYQANRKAGIANELVVPTTLGDEQALARVLAAMPADARIYSANPPLGYSLSYMSERPVLDARKGVGSDPAPRYLVTSAGDYAVFPLEGTTADWLHRNGKPVFGAGGYLLYAITGAEPIPLP